MNPFSAICQFLTCGTSCAAYPPGLGVEKALPLFGTKKFCGPDFDEANMVDRRGPN